jgi:hypothetical protein
MMFTVGVLVLISLSGMSHAADTRKSVVFILNDGHRQSFALAEISRIDFKEAAIVVLKDGGEKRFSLAEVTRIEFEPAGASESQFGRNHFLGKWRVGEGNGQHFYITLNDDGHATKSIGSRRGTWVVVDGEARISWDDGWHDVIRKAGSRHEKVAFAPGKSFSDEPDNVTDAQNTDPQPI